MPYDFQFVQDGSHTNWPLALPGITMCGFTPERLATTLASVGHPGAAVIFPGIATNSDAFLYIPSTEKVAAALIYFFTSSKPIDKPSCDEI